MKRYRIYVEDCVMRELVLSIVRCYVESATIYEATGLWERKAEDTLVIEVIEPISKTHVIDLARELKTALNQEAVLITLDEVSEVTVI